MSKTFANHIAQHGSNNSKHGPRDEDDFYATNPEMVRLLLDSEYAPPKDKPIWECAAGNGAISEILNHEGYRTFSTDIIDRGYYAQDGTADFLTCNDNAVGKETEGEPWRGTILTNPPFKLVTEFVIKALELVADEEYVYMLTKMQFQEGQERYNKIFSKYPQKYILQFVKRYNCYKGGDKDIYKNSTSPFNYQWNVWQKGYTGKTIFDWLI